MWWSAMQLVWGLKLIIICWTTLKTVLTPSPAEDGVRAEQLLTLVLPISLAECWHLGGYDHVVTDRGQHKVTAGAKYCWHWHGQGVVCSVQRLWGVLKYLCSPGDIAVSLDLKERKLLVVGGKGCETLDKWICMWTCSTARACWELTNTVSGSTQLHSYQKMSSLPVSWAG